MEKDFCCEDFKFYFDRGCVYRGNAYLFLVAIIKEKNEDGDFWILPLYNGLDEVKVLIEYCPFCGRELEKIEK